MRLRFALCAIALSCASFGVAQDTVQLKRGVTLTGKLAELDTRAIVLQEVGPTNETKIFPQDSVSLTRFADGRLYVYANGRPVRVTRQEIAPARALRIETGVFSDKYYSNDLEVPRAAFYHQLHRTPRLAAELNRAHRLQQTGRVLGVPAGLLAGLAIGAAINPNLEVNPQFAVVAAAAAITTLTLTLAGDRKQREALARINAGLK